MDTGDVCSVLSAVANSGDVCSVCVQRTISCCK